MNKFYVPSLILALFIGILIGSKGCSKKETATHSSPNSKVDTVQVIKFVETKPDTVLKYKDKVIYVTKLLPGDTKTIIKEVPRIEYQVQEKLITRLVKDSTCKDSILSYQLAIQELKDSVAKLQEFTVFSGQTKNKLYKQTYAILGRDVSNMNQVITIRKRLELTPIIGLSYQTNGKSFKDFTYKPFVGGTINYSHFSLFGGMLWDTNSNNLNQYIIGGGYKLTL